MNPPEHFVEQLQRYDPKLSVEWDNRIQRGYIYREGRDGRRHKIMAVVGPGGSFRPLDNRVMETLYRCDTWRFGGQDWNRWRNGGRRAWLNSLGERDGEDDPFTPEAERAAEKRYHEDAEELARKIMHFLKKDPAFAPTEEEARLGEELMVAKEATEQAVERGEGILVWDHTLKTPRPKDCRVGDARPIRSKL